MRRGEMMMYGDVFPYRPLLISIYNQVFSRMFLFSLFLQTNCNLICGPEYTAETKRSMAQINEKETSFELVEALLKYIETLQVSGAVLIFLPGWNLIYSMQRHLESNPHFGTLHIQTPLRLVFSPQSNSLSVRSQMRVHSTGGFACRSQSDSHSDRTPTVTYVVPLL